MFPAHPLHLDIRPAWDLELFMSKGRAVPLHKLKPGQHPASGIKPSRASPGKGRKGFSRGGKRK